MLPEYRDKDDKKKSQQVSLLCIRRRILSSTLKERFVVGCIIFLFIYKRLLYQYGTIAPPATVIYTRPFEGLSATDYPPEGWRAPFRVVVSLTTTPNRLSKVSNAVNSLLAQRYAPDAVYLNVPEGPMKRHPERSYDEVSIPAEINSNPKVTVIRSIDYGPATKLIPALHRETDPDTLIITVDDDFEYPELLTEALAWEAYHRPKDALGVCGWGTMPVPGSIGMVPVYVAYLMRPYGRYVDILQACCGNAYRRRYFSDLTTLENMPSVCVTVDDVWIAGVLAVQEKVDRAIISKRLDPYDPDWKIEEAKSAAAGMKLSNFNDANEIHIKCVEAVESRFGQKWKRVYQT